MQGAALATVAVAEEEASLTVRADSLVVIGVNKGMHAVPLRAGDVEDVAAVTL